MEEDKWFNGLGTYKIGVILFIIAVIIYAVVCFLCAM